MRRVGYILSALLLLVCVSAPAFAQQPFADVPLNHWAYNAVNGLAEQGLLEGYPDGTFQGKERLTRYEFAQAIARLLERIEEMGGAPGPPGPPGPPGAPAAVGGAALSPEQKAMLDKLAKEFGPELKALRSDLDGLTKRVEDLEEAPAGEFPTITVSGDISWRLGLYGTSLGIEDVETSGYPFFEELIGFENGYYYDGVGAAQGGFGYAVAPYGGINIPFYDSVGAMWSDDPLYPGGPAYQGTIPISDALKDAYKTSDFMTQKTRVNFSGQLSPETAVNVTLLTGPENNDVGSALDDFAYGSPLFVSGNGVMDTVSVDEAWLRQDTRILAPAEVTVGKQYFSRGEGLLADNDQEALKSLRIDWNPGDSISWGALWGMLDREMFYGGATGAAGLPAEFPNQATWTDPTTSGQDNYNLYYLDWMLSDDWCVGANWLESGFNQEQGWSASLMGELYGLDFYGEYAQLMEWPDGEDTSPTGLELDESDNAWMGGLRWSTPAVCVTGEYGEIDAGYALALSGGGWSVLHPLVGSLGMYTDYLNLPLSALHPNAAVDPHDINWIDRPLFLDPTNIARGWHVNVTFPKLLGERTPVSVSYMDGDGYEPRYLNWLSEGGPVSGIPEPDKWRDADSVWVVEVSHQVSDSVCANLLYGRREVDNIMSPQTVPIDIVGETSVFVENDPIQVIRGEVIVAF